MFKLDNIKYKQILNIKFLEIKKNKVTTIIGQSGSGKTSLLKLLNKLASPDKGTILYNQQDLSDIDSIKLRREVVMLPQSPAIFNGSIRDNLLIALQFSEKTLVSDDRLEEILKIIKLDKNLDTNASDLSGGEKQRLAIGRIILIEPEVLLLDEPSSALDEGTEDFIISALVKYTRENKKTLIMVTHSKKVANSFSDEIIEIVNGTILDRGGE